MKPDVARAITVPAVLAGAFMFTGAALAQRISPEAEALLTRDVRGAADKSAHRTL